MPLKKVYNSPWFVKVVFVISLFLVLFIAGISYKHITNVSESQDLVVHTYQVNLELEQIFSYLKDAEVGERGFIVTKDSLYLEPLLNSRSKIRNCFEILEKLTENNKSQHKNLKELRALVSNRIHSLDGINDEVEKKPIEIAKFKEVFLESKAYMTSVRKHLSLMISFENNLLEERLKNHETNIKFTPVFLFSSIVFTLILIFLAYVKIDNDLEKLEKKNHELLIFNESTKQAEIINKHGSWRWNDKEDTFYFSDNLFRLLGEEPNAFEHTLANFMKFVHPEDINKLTEQTNKMMENKDLPFIFYRIILRTGEIRYLKAYGKSIVNIDGETQLLGTTTDITDEIDHFNTLEKRNQELELNNKELQAFNYVASHDLQEPLRKIQTFLSRLEDSDADTFSEKGKLYMSRINKAATRMRNLIDDLLQYSRTNKSHEIKKNSDINELIENAQQNLAEVIISEEATITVANFPEMKVIPFQIEQLFSNLISNSLKYKLKERKPDIKIDYQKVSQNEHPILEESLHESFHKITFKDNGIGFKQEYATKIFELFNRLHTKDQYSGTGIGLSICKKIINNHNGFILANGVPNESASFTIYLPFV